MNENLSPTIAKLRSLPNNFYNPIWPQGTRQPYSIQIADYFFSLLSTSETSLLELLRAHPELPPWSQLNNWRRRKPDFAQAWRDATQLQADFLVQKCLDLYSTATVENAHLTRVKFDILKFIAAKFHPEVWGDKPAQQQQTTVNVGISISPQRLVEIRTKLDSTRQAFSARSPSITDASTSSIVSPTLRNSNGNGSVKANRKAQPGSSSSEPGPIT